MKILNYNDRCAQESSVFPDTLSSLCAPVLHTGTIEQVYLTDGPGLNDWTDPWEWKARLDNLSTAMGAMHMLHVRGNKPEEKSKDISLAMDTLLVRPKDFRLSIEMDETGTENYEFLRYLECSRYVRFWYQTPAYLYGGNEGIEGEMTLSEVIGSEHEGVNHFKGELKWEARHHPERTGNPFGAYQPQYSISASTGQQPPYPGTVEWDLPFTIVASISSGYFGWGGLFFRPGELGIEVRPEGAPYIGYSLNDEGELILEATAPSDVDKYSINSQGQLCWEE